MTVMNDTFIALTSIFTKNIKFVVLIQNSNLIFVQLLSKQEEVNA